MNSKITLCALLSCGLVALDNLSAATVSSDWNLLTTGTYSWHDNANWNSSTWGPSTWNPSASTSPNNSTNTFSARIINTGANNITVETASAVTVGRLDLERTSTGSLTLKLGGNMTVTGVQSGPPTSGVDSRPTGFINSVANTSTGLIIDLNSHTFDASGAAATALQNAQNYTLRDSSLSGTGSFVVQNIGRTGSVNGAVQVENNVTVKLTTYAATDFRASDGGAASIGWNFSKDSTLWFAANGSGSAVAFNNSSNNQFGNVIVGSLGNSTASQYNLGNHITIKGDLTYLGGSLLSMFDGKRRIYLQGNLTDTSTTGADYNGRGDEGGFVFNGGLAKEQQILVARQGLTNVFHVGESASVQGNIALLHNLTTTLRDGVAQTGRVVVWDGSRLNVNTFTLQATTVQIYSGAVMAFSFGQGIDNALVKATGVLTLNSFNLELNYNGIGWNDGDNLLLFQYGSLTGPPILDNVTLTGFTYGSHL